MVREYLLRLPHVNVGPMIPQCALTLISSTQNTSASYSCLNNSVMSPKDHLSALHRLHLLPMFKLKKQCYAANWNRYILYLPVQCAKVCVGEGQLLLESESERLLLSLHCFLSCRSKTIPPSTMETNTWQQFNLPFLVYLESYCLDLLIMQDGDCQDEWSHQLFVMSTSHSRACARAWATLLCWITRIPNCAMAKKVYCAWVRHEVLTNVKQSGLCGSNMLGDGTDGLVWVQPGYYLVLGKHGLYDPPPLTIADPSGDFLNCVMPLLLNNSCCSPNTIGNFW